MTKFVVDIENNFLSIDGHEFELIEIEVAGKKSLICETELKSLSLINLSVAEYPINLIIDIDNETGFDTYLFHKLSVSKLNDVMIFDFEWKLIFLQFYSQSHIKNSSIQRRI